MRQSLLIINGDQIIEKNLFDLVKNFLDSGVDAGTVVFNSVIPDGHMSNVMRKVMSLKQQKKNPLVN